MSASDFDFLHGSWRIAHRYLTERLTGCDEWITFESSMRCWPILGGAANMDEERQTGQFFSSEEFLHTCFAARATKVSAAELMQ